MKEDALIRAHALLNQEQIKKEAGIGKDGPVETRLPSCQMKGKPCTDSQIQYTKKN
jgi:hypothetical protein